MCKKYNNNNNDDDDNEITKFLLQSKKKCYIYREFCKKWHLTLNIYSNAIKTSTYQYNFS